MASRQHLTNQGGKGASRRDVQTALRFVPQLEALYVFMNNRDRKDLMLNKLTQSQPQDIFEALNSIGSEIEELEAIPFNRRNETTRICEDYMNSDIDGAESVGKLKEFILCVPD